MKATLLKALPIVEAAAVEDIWVIADIWITKVTCLCVFWWDC